MQGVVGGGETPFSRTRFSSFYFFYFSFSRHYEALCIEDARKYFSVTHLLPNISLTRTSVTQSRSLFHHSLRPSPSLPHDSDHAECGGVLCLHGSTPFQYFRAGAIGTIDWNFESNYHGILPYNFVQTSRHRKSTKVAPPGRFLKKFDETIGGKNPRKKKLWGLIPRERYEIQRWYTFAGIYPWLSMNHRSLNFFSS